MRIVIADDHELVRDTISAFLAREDDIEVSSASDFPSSIEKIEGEGPFDLVLLDLDLPEMDGVTVMETLRREGYSRSIAALTAHGDAAKRKACLQEGFDEYLTKPITHIVDALSTKA